MTDNLRVKGHYAFFGGTTWPLPDGEISWLLRYGTPTRGDLLLAASVISAYSALIKMPERRRRPIIATLRRAIAIRRDGKP